MNANSLANEVINEVRKAVVGKDTIIAKVLLAIIAKGHILIEDIPGVGKTTLALSFSKVLSLKYNRMQFTPDVLPSDVTGFSIYNKKTGEFEFKQGAAFCNLFLADEINRTSSKTQSALLELMEEGRITVDSVTRKLPTPYAVIATQNPIGSAGTHMLPDSQLDRFMIRLSMGYPNFDSEVKMLKSKHVTNPLESIKSVITQDELIYIQDLAEQTYISDEIYKYITELVTATRKHPLVKVGVSPRGSVAITSIAKAVAAVNGRKYVIPDDIAYIFIDVTAHRIILSPKAKISSTSAETILKDILKTTPVPEINA